MSMSYIQEVARAALQTAGTDLAKARRAFMLAAGVLALIHLLTVYPYLQTSQEIAAVKETTEENAALLAAIEPEIERLQQASNSAASGLTELLVGVTDDMIRRFEELRDLVARASRGETFTAAFTSQVDDRPIQQPVQQMMAPQASNMPPSTIQQTAPVPADGQPQIVPPTTIVPSELKPILDAIVAKDPDAYRRLIDYARDDIVAAAYMRAESEWTRTIRPRYVEALGKTGEEAQQASESASASAVGIAEELAAAAQEMERQRVLIEAIEIRHDAEVDAALGTEWWLTVEGKISYAAAVKESIAKQMRAIAEAAGAPAASLRTALDLQQKLSAALEERQGELEKQFADQRQQLAGLSGASGVIPVDLATFIGVFPLVLGLALGFMLLRAGEARRQAAIAADDLAAAGSEDEATRLYLVRRALGGGAAFGPLALTGGLALGALAWIGLAATQIGASPIEPLLSAETSGVIAALVVLAAAAWDGAAIRRLAANLER